MNKRISNKEAIEIRRLYWDEGCSRRRIGDMYGVSTETISRIIRGDTHKQAALAQEHIRQNTEQAAVEAEAELAEAAFLADSQQPKVETELEKAIREAGEDRAAKYGVIKRTV